MVRYRLHRSLGKQTGSLNAEVTPFPRPYQTGGTSKQENLHGTVSHAAPALASKQGITSLLELPLLE